jgi:hypothetical protein
MDDSQDEIYTQSAADVTMEMMSPNTTLLLSNMVDVSGVAVGRSNDGGNGAGSSFHFHDNNNNKDRRARNGNSRRPLHSIHNSSTATTTTSKNKPSTTSRTKGPKETTYLQQHHRLVSKIIRSYSTKHHAARSLPNYHDMNGHQRVSALGEVDALLARLSCNDVHSGEQGGSDSLSFPEVERVLDTQPNSTAGSNIERQHQPYANYKSFGSATTMGESSIHNNNNARRREQSIGSETTMGGGGGAASLYGEQSVSFLEESMVLLSEDESGYTGGGKQKENEDEESRFSGGDVTERHQQCQEVSRNINKQHASLAQQRQRNSDSPSVASIERARHYQQQHDSRSTILNDDDDEASSPSFTHKQPLKRCASNSGKRGLKSRHRSSSINEFPTNEYDEDAPLRHFERDDGGGLFMNDAEDVFSCGSPIQRIFSYDGLDLDEEERRDTVSELPSVHKQQQQPPRGGERGHDSSNESEGGSMFSLHGGDKEEDVVFEGNSDYYNDDYDDDDDCALGGNWDRSQSQQYTTAATNQQSQWSTFRNSDAKLTSTQMEEDDEDESPVRRRAIRFDAQSQRTITMSSLRGQSSVTKRRQHAGLEEEEEEEEEGEIDEEVTHVEERMADIDVGGDQKPNADGDDPIQTVRNLSRRAKALESQGLDSSLLDEVAPIDIRLRDGVHFRMDPLRCRQNNDKSAMRSKSKKHGAKSVKIIHPKDNRNAKAMKGAGTSTASRCYSSDSDNSLSEPETLFNDPIARFPSRVAARLNVGFNFMLEKESNVQLDNGAELNVEESVEFKESSAVLLSMDINQIVSVTSKLLIHTIKSSRIHQRSNNDQSNASSKRYTPSNLSQNDKEFLAGGTLIVLRDKADSAQWEVALREYTSLSVMNHAAMQSTLRKLATTGSKCAGFDVVLTTYDALKSKEVTVPVDADGRAILRSKAEGGDGDADDGGWLTSRGSGTQTGVSAPQKCHQLSVLHRMAWYRVVLMDVLGRKGYLTKPGTARSQAAIAVNSSSR